MLYTARFCKVESLIIYWLETVSVSSLVSPALLLVVSCASIYCLNLNLSLFNQSCAALIRYCVMSTDDRRYCGVMSVTLHWQLNFNWSHEIRLIFVKATWFAQVLFNKIANAFIRFNWSNYLLNYDSFILWNFFKIINYIKGFRFQICLRILYFCNQSILFYFFTIGCLLKFLGT